MGRVAQPSSDVVTTLAYYAVGRHLQPNYMFTPPHRQHGILYKTIAASYCQEIQERLRTNMLFNWLLGEYGPIDDFVITKSHVENMFEELWGFPINYGLISNQLIIGKELKYWDHILNGENRRKPLKVDKPSAYPVMNEFYE